MTKYIDTDYDCYDFNDESDQEPYESSEDDIDVILHGTPEQKRKLESKVRQRSHSSSEDDFEKEMNSELDKHIQQLKNQHSHSEISTQIAHPGTSELSDQAVSSEQKFYDDVYFDSDEEEMVLQGDERVKQRQKRISNDDLLYDPKLDEEDQKWMDSHRQSYRASLTQTKKLPSSDAVLNCPACMTLLCLDCQRHESYQNQYRAMFVMNCRVDTTELLKQPLKKKKRKKQNTGAGDSGDNFHPVKCTECSTVVGVFDNDEVYHFFNVLASY